MRPVYDKNDMIISHLTLRKAIGWLGMLLPFILLISNYYINSKNILTDPTWINTQLSEPYRSAGNFKSSISHYYYTTVGEIFTGILITVSLFLFCYKGHPKRAWEKGLSDGWLTTLAGFSSLCVVIFPTSSTEKITDNLRIFQSSELTGTIHLSMASLFFILLAIMSIVNFRRTDTREGFGKEPKHKVYLICGIGMLSSLGLIAIYILFFESKQLSWLTDLHPVFCFETTALIFFGISWLTKGRVDFAYIPRMLRWVKNIQSSQR